MSAAEGRRLAAILLGSILLLGLGTVLYIRHGIDRRWEAMEGRVRLIHAAVAAQGNRPVLRGQAVPGDARADYETITTLTAKWDYRDQRLLIEFLDKPSTIDRNRIDSLLTRGAPILAAMQRGAARSGCARLDESSGNPAILRSGEGVPLAIALAMAQARVLRESGRFREAAELLLDTLRYEGAYALPDEPFEEVEALLQSEGLPTDVSELLQRGLEILDGSFPTLGEELDRSLFILGTVLLRSRGGATDALEGYGYPGPSSGWRSCFSPRLLEVDAFETIDRCHEELKGAYALPWEEALSRQKAMRSVSTNVIVEQFEFDHLDSDLLYRGFRARLRVLRVAARFRATGGILDLGDPFGGRLRVQEGAGKLRISSVGEDGTQEFRLMDFWRDPSGKMKTVPLALEVSR